MNKSGWFGSTIPNLCTAINITPRELGFQWAPLASSQPPPLSYTSLPLEYREQTSSAPPTVNSNLATMSDLHDVRIWIYDLLVKDICLASWVMLMLASIFSSSLLSNYSTPLKFRQNCYLMQRQSFWKCFEQGIELRGKHIFKDNQRLPVIFC